MKSHQGETYAGFRKFLQFKFVINFVVGRSGQQPGRHFGRILLNQVDQARENRSHLDDNFFTRCLHGTEWAE